MDAFLHPRPQAPWSLHPRPQAPWSLHPRPQAPASPLPPKPPYQPQAGLIGINVTLMNWDRFVLGAIGRVYMLAANLSKPNRAYPSMYSLHWSSPHPAYETPPALTPPALRNRKRCICVFSFCSAAGFRRDAHTMLSRRASLPANNAENVFRIFLMCGLDSSGAVFRNARFQPSASSFASFAHAIAAARTVVSSGASSRSAPAKGFWSPPRLLPGRPYHPTDPSCTVLHPR